MEKRLKNLNLKTENKFEYLTIMTCRKTFILVEEEHTKRTHVKMKEKLSRKSSQILRSLVWDDCNFFSLYIFPFIYFKLLMVPICAGAERMQEYWQSHGWKAKSKLIFVTSPTRESPKQQPGKAHKWEHRHCKAWSMVEDQPTCCFFLYFRDSHQYHLPPLCFNLAHRRAGFSSMFDRVPLSLPQACAS